MLKGWVTIEGTLAEKYQNQVGNTYYYDKRTGLMAKGWVTIDGIQRHFDENTGVLITE
jgi:glucan-binding YG repeat protein